MGGNAIKSATRLKKQDYLKVEEDVKQFFALKGVKTAVPLSYSSKEDFGDLDIIVENTGNMKELIDDVNVYFNVKEFYKNNTIYSFGYDYNGQTFQVDLIFVTTKDFESSYNYLCYNDLFNLLGRIAHKQGFKLGHDGLKVVVKNGDYLLGEVVISKNLEIIFDILDVDINRYREGFETFEDIFDFVIASKWFDSAMFKLENLNNINRVRNAKRKLYMQFIEYTKDIPEKNLKIDKEENVRNILQLFPNAREDLAILKYKLKVQQETALKFNGDIVKELTGRENKELGELMKVIKTDYNVGKLHSMTESEIKEMILEYNRNLKGNKGN